VLDHIQMSLNPHRIEKDYCILVANEVTLTGETAETFTCSVTKKSDNFKVVMATVGAWRAYYAEVYATEPEYIMRIIATQCVQGLPKIEVLNGTQKYTCYSPSAVDPRSGRIHLSYPTTSKTDNFTNLSTFRKYYEELPKTSFC
jgi:hypothetical protein